MGIWAHPDDETWGSAGVMAAAIDNGQKVVCVVATKGEAGKTAHPDNSSKQSVSQIREDELKNALNIIGIDDLRLMNYSDGHLEEVSEENAVTNLLKIINEVKPDTILTFEPNGITGHNDHKIVSKWSQAAIAQLDTKPVIYGACETRERYEEFGRECDKYFNVYFRVAEPVAIAEKDCDLLFKLSQTQTDQKLKAFKSYNSQYSGFFKIPQGRNYLESLSRTESFIKLNS